MPNTIGFQPVTCRYHKVRKRLDASIRIQDVTGWERIPREGIARVSIFSSRPAAGIHSHARASDFGTALA